VLRRISQGSALKERIQQREKAPNIINAEENIIHRGSGLARLGDKFDCVELLEPLGLLVKDGVELFVLEIDIPWLEVVDGVAGILLEEVRDDGTSIASVNEGIAESREPVIRSSWKKDVYWL